MDNENQNPLYSLFLKLPPSELARIRGRQKETSTRDKARLLKKIEEVEHVLEKINIKIILEKK